jgi:hypothetical protein
MIEKESLSKLSKEQLVSLALKQAKLVGYYTIESPEEEIEENAFKQRVEFLKTTHGGKEELVDIVVLLSDKIKSLLESSTETRGKVEKLLKETEKAEDNLSKRMEELSLEDARTNDTQYNPKEETDNRGYESDASQSSKLDRNRIRKELLAKRLTDELMKKFVEESESEVLTSNNNFKTRETKEINSNINKVKFDKSLPKFGGNASDNFDDWLFLIESCQKYNNLKDEEMMGLVLPLLRGQALQILKRMRLFESNVDWPKFRNELINTYITDTKERKLRKELKDLKQKSNFNEYLAKFRELANQLTGMPEHELINAFIDGLKHKARYECIMRRTDSLQEAMRVARILRSVMKLIVITIIRMMS